MRQFEEGLEGSPLLNVGPSDQKVWADNLELSFTYHLQRSNVSKIYERNTNMFKLGELTLLKPSSLIINFGKIW